MITFNKATDLIAIIAPSSKRDESEKKLGQAQTLLEAHGFKSTYASDIFSGDTLPFFSANKNIRLTNLQQALLHPDVKIIWVFHGGYGCSQIVFDCLELFPKPKILIGFSDATALHLLFNQHYKIPSLHAAVLHSILSESHLPELDLIINILAGGEVRVVLEPVNIVDDIDIIGQIIGGNLTVFCNMLSSKLHPITHGKVLLLEDVNESAYRIHRSLIHLKNAGIFDRVSAVVFGDFIHKDEDCDQTIEHFCINEINNIPSYRLRNIGHGSINYPIILGEQACIRLKHLTVTNPFRLVK